MSAASHSAHRPAQAHGTTVLAVRRPGHVVLCADGQVTLGQTVIKHAARKLRTLHQGAIVAGFAGSTADALTLFSRFEIKLKDTSGNLTRAAVELTQEWRSDRMLRRLEAMLLVADIDKTFLLSGTGDVMEPDGGAMAIGSGGNYALCAARALLENTEMGAEAIAARAMALASDLCIYTNSRTTTLQIGGPREP